MTYLFSKAISVASAVYGAYAIARPAHLGRALSSAPETKHDLTARVLGARDVVISTAALTSTNPPLAMAARIAFDIGDCLLLRPAAETATARRTLTGITLGWATVNATALLVDRLRTR